ncbi:FecCD family ABC transporter permease [Agrobacterium tumefaciens]|uniref:FecCD family ABC transporter permease n=1 Tax=Agrobacterium tumefaciens TaxID=358 RepID=UPI0015768FDF|nr:iron ABC transporter permease [Agrobacterium tumefaciens]NTZ92407.1 iron ABC transporter permease [Agrobacterium tumefaciens]
MIDRKAARPVTACSVRSLALAVLLCLLILAAMNAVALGTSAMSFSTITAAIFQFDGSRDHLLVTTIRLPRVIAALLSGSALAVSGAIMQAVTNNPLASPGLLGINAGASFAVVLVMTLFGTGIGDIYVWFAFIGAGIAAIVVYALGSIGAVGHSPLGLVLAGAIVATFLTSLTTAILIFDQSTLDAVRLWTAGSVTGRTMAQAKTVAPYILTGLLAALFLGRHLTTLSLGADASRALGQNPVIWRGASVLVVILLAGGAVALAGPIGFVGLVVPHMVRMIAGVDYRWVIPFSALAGALLVVVSDTVGRLVFGSQSFPVGVTIALIGAPFFLYLARTRLRGSA